MLNPTQPSRIQSIDHVDLSCDGACQIVGSIYEVKFCNQQSALCVYRDNQTETLWVKAFQIEMEPKEYGISIIMYGDIGDTTTVGSSTTDLISESTTKTAGDEV